MNRNLIDKGDSEVSSPYLREILGTGHPVIIDFYLGELVNCLQFTATLPSGC